MCKKHQKVANSKLAKKRNLLELTNTGKLIPEILRSRLPTTEEVKHSSCVHLRRKMYESSMIHHDFSFGTSCISYIICVGSSQHLVIRNHRSQALRTHIWHFSAFPVLRVDASKFRKGSLQHLCFCVLIRSLFSSRLWHATSANLCSFRLILIHAHCKNNGKQEENEEVDTTEDAANTSNR